MLVLLYLFNAIVTSLRGLQQASDLKKVQKKLGSPRFSGFVIGVSGRL